MKLALSILLGISIIVSGDAAMADVFESFETDASIGRWEFTNGPEFPGAAGEFRITRAAAKEGILGGELRFDFRRGGNYVQASFEVPPGVAARQVWLSIKKPTANRLTIRCTDSEGQTFQRGSNYSYRGWQELRIALDGWQVHWGGKNDGVFRGSPSRVGFLVENDAARTGSVFIDDVRLVNEASSVKVPQSEYQVLSFGEGESWSPIANGNSGASRWTAPGLRYDFTGGASAIGVHSDIAILGRPSRITLALDGEDTGASVRLQLAGHFQVFEKTLGKLSGAGKQEFTADLDGMRGWRHYGGEDNGVPQMPLRVIAVYLDREGASQGGQVRLVGMRAATTIAPEMAVVLVPSSRLAGSRATFSCTLRNLTPSETQGVLSWSVRDWSGRETGAGSRKLAIRQGESVSHEIPAAMRGPFAECVFRYTAGSRTYGPVSTTAVLPVEGSGARSLEPDSPFGMGIYLYRAASNEDGRRDMEAKAALAAAAGVKWSREEFQWHRVEPERGKFDFSFYDDLVETANRHGISVYGLIAYWSGWTKPYTMEGVQDYARYCKALVTRYRDRIKHWEVWNEPNIFFWSGPKELYADLLKAAYAAIKEADPEAVVLGCSTAGIDTGFIEGVIKAGAPFDILTVHPYRGVLDETGFIKELRDTASLAKTADGEAKPVWITEMGLPTQLYGGLSERNQATFLARCYLSALASGVDTNISWYDFREDGGNPFYNEHRFGVVRHPDMSPKAAFRALATVCRTLAGQRLKKQLDLGQGILAFHFAGSDGETVVLWSPLRDKICGLSVSGQVAAITDLMGSRVTPAKAGGVTVLPLRAASPVFVIGRGLDVRKSGAGLSVDSPGAVHAGDAVRIALKGASALGGASLQAPPGWKVRPRGNMSFDVAVPAGAGEGPHELTLTIGAGRNALTLPVSLEVTPQVLNI